MIIIAVVKENKEQETVIESLLKTILNDIKEEQKEQEPQQVTISQFLQAISDGSATPRSISMEDLQSMIVDKQHEVLVLNQAFANAKCYTERAAIQMRLSHASKELNQLMTLEQCR